MSIRAIGRFFKVSNFKKLYKTNKDTKSAILRQFYPDKFERQNGIFKSSLQRDGLKNNIFIKETKFGNKKLVRIIKYDYSQPQLTTIYNKDKYFIDGKVVYSIVKKDYQSQPVFGNFFHNI